MILSPIPCKNCITLAICKARHKHVYETAKMSVYKDHLPEYVVFYMYERCSILKFYLYPQLPKLINTIDIRTFVYNVRSNKYRKLMGDLKR